MYAKAVDNNPHQGRCSNHSAARIVYRPQHCGRHPPSSTLLPLTNMKKSLLTLAIAASAIFLAEAQTNTIGIKAAYGITSLGGTSRVTRR